MTEERKTPDTEPMNEEERIRKWREERLAVADAQRQERLKQAELDRAKRLEQFEAEREERARSGTDERRRQIAGEENARIEEAREKLPGSEALAEARKTILKGQRRRRRNLVLQMLGLVIIPTILVWFYVAKVAVPLYEARSVFNIDKASEGAPNPAAGVLGALAPPSHLNEAFMALEYIKSPALIQELEKEVGILTYFSGPEMDPIARVRDVASMQISQDALFRRYVDAAINVQTGLVTLYVRARSPDDAEAFSQAILSKAQAHINSLSAALFRERIEQSEESVAKARAALEKARLDLIQQQIESRQTDPQMRIATIYEIIAGLERDLQVLQTEIGKTALAGYSDAPQMKTLRAREQLLREQIDEQLARLVDDSRGKSLNESLADHEFAKLQVEIANMTWATGLSVLEDARKSAALGVSHFQVVVPPLAPAISTRPNRIETTMLAFFGLLAFMAILRVFFVRRN